jgi:NAD-dependent SIR2 family protein deacetylase
VIEWPVALIREIANRRCAFFLGAGVSATAVAPDGTHPKGWDEFLVSATALVRMADLRRQIEQLVCERRYLLALQAIKTCVDRADYQHLLNQNFNTAAFRPGRIHEIIYSLDARLVITTNFDKIYERYCLGTSTEGFKVITYESPSLGDELRSETRLIIKAHGTIDNIHQMIFTRAEYHEMKQQHGRFYELLKAIFLLNTVVFVGCGLDDPDVILLLEEVNITASSNRPHYILVREGSHSDFALNDWEQTFNVRALRYGPDHANLLDDLEILLQHVESARATFGAVA